MKKQTVFFYLLSLMVFWHCPEHLFCEYSQRQPVNGIPSGISDQNRIQHHVHNLETEISYLKQKIENQEATIDTLRQEVTNLIKATKELNAKSHDSQDAKIAKFEKNIEKLLADMKQFKTHANETTESLASTQKTIHAQAGLEKQQAEKIEALESAMKSLVKALQGKEKGPSAKESITSSGRYRVKSGDSLAKIAKELKISTHALKELNGLQSDKITVGQELQIPQ